MKTNNIMAKSLSVYLLATTAYVLTATPLLADELTDIIAQNSLSATSGPETSVSLWGETPVIEESVSLVPPTGAPEIQIIKAAAPVTATTTDVDLAALYYYAKERMHERVDAEIRRLQTVHPGFVPPEDLYVTAQKQKPSEQILWDMFAADDFTGIDAEIIRRKTIDPNWEPTEDFSGKLLRKKQRVQMKELARSEDWVGVANIGRDIDPRTETDIDLVWTLIDAYAYLGNKAALSEAYQGLLFRDDVSRLSDEHLLVTLQKATRDFSAVEIRRVMTTLWPVSDQVPGIDDLKLNLVRKAVANFNEGVHTALTVGSRDVARLEQAAIADRSVPDLSVLGWYYLKLEKPSQAADLFEIAMQLDKNADNAKGMYLSLVRQGRDKQAYEFARNNLSNLAGDPVFLMNVLSPKFSKPVPGAITEDTLVAYSSAILEASSADHAEILGWYAYNSRQFEAAKAWFKKALVWEENADRVKGLALTHLRLGDKSGYQDLKENYAYSYPDIWTKVTRAKPPAARKAVAVSKPKLNVKTNYVKHFERKDYKSCLQELDRLSANGLTANAWLIRGWCYLAMARVTEAQDSFTQAMNGAGSVKTDAVYGKALALLRVRQTDDAEALIRSYSLSQRRNNELFAEIYYQRARSAFDFKQYDQTLIALKARAKIVDEPRDLTLMRGWAYHNLGYANEANTIFRRLNAHLRDHEAAHGAYVTSGHRG